MNSNPFDFSGKDESLFSRAGLPDAFSSFTSESLYKNPFEGRDIVRPAANRDTLLEASRRDGRIAIGGRKTALLILAYNRPQFLLRTFNQIIKVLASPSNSFYVDLVISQDGTDSTVTTLLGVMSSRVKAEVPFCSFLHLKHKTVKLETDAQYGAISYHLSWALSSLFGTYTYEQVIVLDVAFQRFSHR